MRRISFTWRPRADKSGVFISGTGLDAQSPWVAGLTVAAIPRKNSQGCKPAPAIPTRFVPPELCGLAAGPIERDFGSVRHYGRGGLFWVLTEYRFILWSFQSRNEGTGLLDWDPEGQPDVALAKGTGVRAVRRLCPVCLSLPVFLRIIRLCVSFCPPAAPFSSRSSRAVQPRFFCPRVSGPHMLARARLCALDSSVAARGRERC